MTPQQEAQIVSACESFQSFAITQVIYDWIRSSSDPQALAGELIRAWQGRMNAEFDAIYRRQFEETGLIGNNRGHLDEILAEATRRIRESLNMMLADSEEVDGLAKKYSTAQPGETLQ